MVFVAMLPSSSALLRLFVVALLLLVCTDAVFITFTGVPGERKCFSDDLLGFSRYELQYKMTRALTSFVSVAVTDPAGLRVLEHAVVQPESRDYFHTHDASEYTVCFNFHKKAALSSTSLDVTFELMEERQAVSLREQVENRRAAKAQLSQNSPAFAQAAYIESSLEAIHRDYLYLKQREESMRNTNEDTNTRTWAFSLVTVIVVAAVTWLRHMKLKRFLQRKKILD